MNPLLKVAELGQSLWYDYIQRGLIWSGELHRMTLQDGLRGVTSNPAIFEKAIGHSKDYLPAVRALVMNGAGTGEIFEELAIQDIQLATDVLLPVYEQTKKKDGYVSLEVSPHLAHDTDTTISEAMRLWKRVGRENLMIKVPATPEGIPAIERLISEGINVNVTLLFAVDAYEAVAEAHLRGLEALAAKGGDVSKVASVASFFVSRIDTLIDQQIDERVKKGVDPALGARLEALRGKVAIANAKLAYRSYQRLIAGERWKKVAAKNAMPQRLLWASTGTKNPRYKDTLYVETLIGPDTVNTVPEATWLAFKDHGIAEQTLASGMDEAEAVMKRLGEVDISMRSVTDSLLIDGVVKFADAFDALMSAVERRRQEMLGAALPGAAFTGVDELAETGRLEVLRKQGYVRRLWKKDGRLFGGDRAWDPGSSGFMAWMDVTDRMLARPDALLQLSEDVKREKPPAVVLMGMGGSSLAPDVFRRTFGRQAGFPELFVLDSTVPAQVQALERSIDLSKAWFVVSSKSGTTSEPLAFDQYFFDKVRDGRRFIAVTDPGSKLEGMAKDRGFRAIFPGDPEIGGRYSALSNFGLVAAAAMGLDVLDLLHRADRMRKSCSVDVPPRDNPGVRLGALLGELAKNGRDKLTLLTTPSLTAFGAWLEQLIAESTGKQGKGIIPVDLETLGTTSVYGADRVFAVLRLAKDSSAELDGRVAELQKAGHPVLSFKLEHPADLVQEMIRWEIATATAGHVLGINPFDQPNVQESKDFTKTFLDAFVKSGKLPEVEGERKLVSERGVTVYAPNKTADRLASHAGSLAAILKAHLATVTPGDYVAINAYVEMNGAMEEVLGRIRKQVRDQQKVATTLGFGPRFLHSTGQIHKGGPGSGVFLQITTDDAIALPIPGTPYGFSELKTAQANGDFMALARRDRRLLRLHLSDPKAGLAAIAEALGAK